MKEKTCRYGHQCTSGCGNDFDCPCQADHCCEVTETCEGAEHCDDHYVANKVATGEWDGEPISRAKEPEEKLLEQIQNNEV